MKRLPDLSLLALLALTLWTFWGCLGHPFHFDDTLFLQSAQVTGAESPWHILSPAQTRQATYLTFHLNYRLGGPNPAGFHLFNLLLHLANVAGVYCLTHLLLRKSANGLRRWLPLGAAGIFALHPVQSQAVNYVYQRSTLLAAFFCLLSLCAFIKSETARRKRLWHLSLGMLFILAVAAKEAAFALPLVLLAYIWVTSADWESSEQRFREARSLFLCLGTFMFGGAAWLLYSLYSAGEKTMGFAVAGLSSLEYLVSQLPVVARYLRLLVWPSGLSVEHDMPVASLATPYPWLCLFLLTSLVFLAFRLREAHPAACFLALGFFLFLAPTSSVIPSADLMVEHRLYLPMVVAAPLLALAIATAVRFLPKSRAPAWAAVMGILLAGYAALSRERTHIWGDNVRLWEDVVAKAPRKARAHYNLGVAYLTVNRNRAREEFLKTVELRPHHAQALYNLGWLEQTNGRFDAAVKWYRAAMGADRSHWQARQNLANLYALEGDFGAAAWEFQETIRLNQSYWPAYQGLATLQLRSGRASEAEATLQRLKKIRPDLLEARYLLARTLIEAGKRKEAGEELRALSSLDRDDAFKERIEELQRMMAAK